MHELDPARSAPPPPATAAAPALTASWNRPAAVPTTDPRLRGPAPTEIPPLPGPAPDPVDLPRPAVGATGDPSNLKGEKHMRSTASVIADASGTGPAAEPLAAPARRDRTECDQAENHLDHAAAYADGGSLSAALAAGHPADTTSGRATTPVLLAPVVGVLP